MAATLLLLGTLSRIRAAVRADRLRFGEAVFGRRDEFTETPDGLSRCFRRRGGLNRAHADPHLRGPGDGLYRQPVVREDFQDVSVARAARLRLKSQAEGVLPGRCGR